MVFYLEQFRPPKGPHTDSDPSRILPYQLLAAELTRVYYEKGMPTLTTNEVLALVGLDTDTPDGKTLMDRFVGEKNPGIRGTWSRWSKAIPVLNDIQRLLELNRSPVADMTTGEQVLTETLAIVAIRQTNREHTICFLADHWLHDLYEYRPELVEYLIHAEERRKDIH